MNIPLTHMILAFRPAPDDEADTGTALPNPEDVFARWLLSVPPETDVEQSARDQIALIDRSNSRHRDVQVLRALLAAVAGGAEPRLPHSNL